MAAGPPTPSRKFQPASAAGPAGRPQTPAMRPLLLLAPLAWLLLAEAKGDSKPEGEGAGLAGGRGVGGGLVWGLPVCTGGLGFRGDPGSGPWATDSLAAWTNHFPCCGCGSRVVRPGGEGRGEGQMIRAVSVVRTWLLCMCQAAVKGDLHLPCALLLSPFSSCAN